MGALAIGALVAQGITGVMGAQSAASGAKAQAEAEAAEFQRQQEVAEERRREEMSDRAREADREMASMIAAMAENGGLGGLNTMREAIDIGAMEGLDLARIEANSNREIAALESKARQSIAMGKQAVSNARFKALGSVIGAAGQVGGQLETQRHNRALEDAARSQGLTDKFKRQSGPRGRRIKL